MHQSRSLPPEDAQSATPGALNPLSHIDHGLLFLQPPRIIRLWLAGDTAQSRVGVSIDEDDHVVVRLPFYPELTTPDEANMAVVYPLALTTLTLQVTLDLRT